MAIAKRIFLFLVVNFLIVITISVVLSFLGVSPYLNAYGIDYSQLMIFCLVWGFGGAFISLALSRIMAKMMMGVKTVPVNTNDPELRWLVETVHRLARSSKLPLPEVGIYNSPELNAFATGPTKSRALVAVSTGLLQRMSKDEVEGVLGHEVTHIANGDMVTMTLVQGVVNALVMFIARALAFALSQTVESNKRYLVRFLSITVFEIVFSLLGMIVVGYFSRAREFRADKGGAMLAGREKMINALEALKRGIHVSSDRDTLATLKISTRHQGGFLSLIATHPPLDVRISRLQSGV